MKCKCGNEGIYYQAYSNKYLCENCFKEEVERRVKKVVKPYMKRGVKINIGISGGKDSLVMAHILNKLSYPEVKLRCIFIHEGIEGFRDKALRVVKKFCEKEGLELKVIYLKEEFNYTLDEMITLLKEYKPCSICAVFRRYLLNKYSKDSDYLAIGHNLDDHAQTILMNYIEGNIKNIIYFGKDAEGFVKRIKPLKYVPEEEVKFYADLVKLEYQKEPCPYSSLSYRHKMKEIIKLLEKMKPGVRFSIVRGYEKLIKLINYEEKINRCKKCNYPCSGELCKVCQYLELIKERMKNEL
ncbi:PP-loop domain protein [Methanocaldococcus infernus ME]|uniref:PP-loop domain protein n=1 Tax=Methanocaldococcus infernus (strain DSM 11812 / JCM 15783 / ME) TaxID=573063 RepID=D5VRJ4_METIM|nr:TIGR00269 family protein [Methanocaldococcus infernus]ADG13197.1 PP-loop domain protein [Methanocaldococcus infernus ME]